MTYLVHRVDVNEQNMQERLGQFLNTLKGDVLAVIPNVHPTFRVFGATAVTNFVLVIERAKQRSDR